MFLDQLPIDLDHRKETFLLMNSDITRTLGRYWTILFSSDRTCWLSFVKMLKLYFSGDFVTFFSRNIKTLWPKVIWLYWLNSLLRTFLEILQLFIQNYTSYTTLHYTSYRNMTNNFVLFSLQLFSGTSTICTWSTTTNFYFITNLFL